MRAVITLICLATLLQTTVASSAQPALSVESLLATDARLDQAVLDGDTPTLEKLYDADLYHVHVGGVLVDTIDNWRSHQVLKGYYDSRERTDVRARIYGETGVVSFVLTATSPKEVHERYHVPSKTRYRHVRVYVHRPDGWKLAFQQSTWFVNTQQQANDVANYINDKGYIDPQH